MKRVVLGQYLQGDSFVHRMDPRVKLVLMALFMVSVLFVRSPVGVVAPSLFLALAVAASRVPLGTVARMCRPIVIFVVLTFVVNLWLVRTGDVLIAVGPLSATSDGLVEAFVLSWRIFALMLAGALVALCTSPTALTDGAERLLAPLSRLGVPVSELATMFSIAVRFVPTLSTELRRVVAAQAARGAALDEGSLSKRAKTLVSMIVPLFASALRHAEGLADAMEARGYEGGKGRTHYHVLRIGKEDLIATAVFVVYAAVAIASSFAA